MLIRLLPIPPHPSVLFNINFEDLPDGLSLPPTWTTHLSNLVHGELPMPRWQHTLDKATFFPCILDEVIFDIPANLVTCRFIDGTITEWKINAEGLATKCLKTLEGVVDDVCLSTLGAEQERQREKHKKEQERERARERLRQQQLVSPPSLVKSTKHKKKRSILMTIVSGLSSLNSIINLSLPSPTVSAVSSPPIPLTPNLNTTPSLPAYKPIPPPPQNTCPRFLRRRARSSLVDAFRLYVLYELNQRIPQGGYYIWVLHSLLNEVRHCQEELFAREREKERERLKSWGPPSQRIPFLLPTRPALNPSTSLTISSPLHLFGRKRQNSKHERRPSHETFSATTSCEPPASDDEEEADSVASCTYTQERSDETDGETIDTDTDESSIQTPTSEHLDLPLGSPSAIASQNFPPLPGPCLQSYSNSAVPTSNSTHFQIHNLTQLILLHNSHSAQMAYEENTRLDALEVRGKRRAWLNCALCPNGIELTRSLGEAKIPHPHKVKIGIGAPHSRLGFSVPIHRSALGIWVVNAGDVESEKAAPMEPKDSGSGRIDSFILEDDMQFVGGERFTGYDERNGIEPKRSGIPVPSNGVQLLPVNEVEEEGEDMKHNQGAPYVPSKSLDSTEHGDDKFFDLNLNRFDSLRELQMDLDIVTGVGFDIMDSSDEEDAESHLNISIPRRHSETATRIPEGMAFDIARHRVLHRRSSQFISCQKQCHRQRVLEASCDQEHHVHQYSHPAMLSERCHTPISPSFPLEPVSEPVNTATSISAPLSSVSSISVSRLATLPAIPSEYTANDPINQNLLCVAKNALETPCCPLSRGASRDLEPTSIDGSELGPILYTASVNDMGELVAGMDTVGLGEDRREEFTLAMDLPSKLPKLSEMDFATMGQTRVLKGHTRGEIDLRGLHDAANPDDMSAIVEEVADDDTWV